MNVFISSSGNRSHKVALALHAWLPSVIQAIKPYVSSENLKKGSAWFTEIAHELDQSNIGIICLTKENVHADWILFEAGALAKKHGTAKVCTLLIDMSPTDVKPPLSEFQATNLADRDDMMKLLMTINSELGDDSLDESRLNDTVEQWWSRLEEDLSKAMQGKAEHKTSRNEKDMLEEILQLSRSMERTLSEQHLPAPGTYGGMVARSVLRPPHLKARGIQGPGGISPGISALMQERKPSFTEFDESSSD